MPYKRTTIMGVPIDWVSWKDIESFAASALQGKRCHQIVTINGEIILIANRQPAHLSAIKNAELVIPDSTNVTWVATMKGVAHNGRTPGSELVWRLCQQAAYSGRSIFLLGAKEGIAAQAAEKLKAKFPRLTIAGTSNADPTDRSVLEIITTAQPDILFVGYGAPAQELWINRNKDKLPCKIAVGVGGAFDMIAGVLPRAPKILQSLHLEWLWRLILQPSRVKRAWNAVVVFPIKAVLD